MSKLGIHPNWTAFHKTHFYKNFRESNPSVNLHCTMTVVIELKSPLCVTPCVTYGGPLLHPGVIHGCRFVLTDGEMKGIAKFQV